MLSRSPREAYFNDLMLVASYRGDEALMQTLAHILRRDFGHSPVAWFYVAMAEATLHPDRDQLQREALERALELDPDFSQGLVLLATLLVGDGELERALGLHQRALDNATGGVPERTVLRRSFAGTLLGAGEVDAALAEYDRGLEEAPGDPVLLEGRATALDARSSD